jgi:hypothetical protein
MDNLTANPPQGQPVKGNVIAHLYGGDGLCHCRCYRDTTDAELLQSGEFAEFASEFGGGLIEVFENVPAEVFETMEALIRTLSKYGVV